MARARQYLLGMYEKSMPMTLSWEEKLTACKKAGFDWVEISIDETDEKIARLTDRKVIDEIKEAIRKTGVPIYTMCFSSQRKYSLGSLGEEKHRKAMENMANAIDFAAEIGIRIIQLAGYDCYYEEANEDTRNEFIKNLKISCNMAARKSIPSKRAWNSSISVKVHTWVSIRISATWQVPSMTSVMKRASTMTFGPARATSWLAISKRPSQRPTALFHGEPV